MYDVTAFGEALIDYTPAGRSEAGMELFEQNPGGAPANLLVAASRLGSFTAFIGKVGKDAQGDLLTKIMEEEGIELRGLCQDPRYFTTMAFVSLSPGGERRFSFARKPGADTKMEWAEVEQSLLKQSRILHFGSLSLTDHPSRETTLKLIQEGKKEGCVISYDPNYRSLLWGSVEVAKEQMRSVLPWVDIMKLSDEETELLTEERDPALAAEKLLSQGIRLVAVTLGREGVLLAIQGRSYRIPGYLVEAIDTTGAGDAFWGAFLHQLTGRLREVTKKMTDEGETPSEAEALVSMLERPGELQEMARFANAAAACCVTKRGGIPAMPTLAQVMEMMESRG